MGGRRDALRGGVRQPLSADECTTAGPDGHEDLTLKFDARAVMAALGAVADREVRLVRLTGRLKPEFGGTPIVGADVVRIQGVELAAADVSAQTSVTISRPSTVRATQTALVRVRNTSARAIDGPLAVLVTQIDPGVSVTNADWYTPAGEPVVVARVPRDLRPGQIATVVLKFVNPARRPFTFALAVHPGN